MKRGPAAAHLCRDERPARTLTVSAAAARSFCPPRCKVLLMVWAGQYFSFLGPPACQLLAGHSGIAAGIKRGANRVLL